MILKIKQNLSFQHSFITASILLIIMVKVGTYIGSLLNTDYVCKDKEVYITLDKNAQRCSAV